MLKKTFLILLAFTTFFSCKKIEKKPSEKESQAQNIENLKAWFSKSKKQTKGKSIDLLSRGISNKNDTRDGTPIWEKTRFYELEKMYVTPITLNTASENKDYFVYKYLIAKQADHDIENGEFFYVFVNKQKSGPNFDELLRNDFNASFFKLETIPTAFYGSLIKFDLSYKKTFSKNYENGNVTNLKSDVSGLINGKLNYFNSPDYPININGCTTYWLLLTDSEGGIIGVYYLYTACENTEPGQQGGGGTPPPPTTCGYTVSDAQVVVNSISGVPDNEEWGHTGFVQSLWGGNNMFEITKLADPNFTYANIVDIHILGNYHCHYVARFAGVVYKKTSNDPEWKWKEFHYSHSERDNGAPPPCFQMSFTAGASTLIANGEKSATASITFTAYLTINVGGYNIESGDPYRTSFTQTFLPIPVP